jgi:hypothetical protein
MRIINFIPDHLQNFFTTWSILRVDFQELRNDITQLLRILVGNSRIHPLCDFVEEAFHVISPEGRFESAHFVNHTP